MGIDRVSHEVVDWAAVKAQALTERMAKEAMEREIRAVRDAQMVARIEAGWSVEQVARAEGITGQRVRMVLRREGYVIGWHRPARRRDAVPGAEGQEGEPSEGAGPSGGVRRPVLGSDRV